MKDRVAAITLNRPRRKDALDQDALNRLVSSIKSAGSDDAVWSILIRANGQDFWVGQDVKELSEKGNQGDYFEPVFIALKSTYKPVACAVRG